MDPMIILCLDSELKISKKMLIKGFSDLQHKTLIPEFYHVPLLLLSNGFERIIKCLLCLNNMDENGKIIRCPYSKKKGHDLKYLLEELLIICKEKMYDQRCPATEKDVEFLVGDIDLNNLISLLSDFGKGARYYNLDIILCKKSHYKNPKNVWSEIETTIWKKKFNEGDYTGEEIKRIHLDVIQILIILLEKFARSLARIFTLGEFGSTGKQIAFNL